MKLFSSQHPVALALSAAFVAAAGLVAVFFMLEPAVIVAADSDTDSFTVRQQVTGELSFVTTADDVDMNGSISGITGGSSEGTTTVAVLTNNATGYHMTLHFSDSTAMNSDTHSNFIANYEPATPGTPDLDFTTPVGSHGFAYSVFPTDAADAVPMFEVNGSTCNSGAGTPTLGNCWYNTADATTPVTIINRETNTAGIGATTTLLFRVGVDANPTPALVTGFYTATATLTATEN